MKNKILFALILGAMGVYACFYINSLQEKARSVPYSLLNVTNQQKNALAHTGTSANMHQAVSGKVNRRQTSKVSGVTSGSSTLRYALSSPIYQQVGGDEGISRTASRNRSQAAASVSPGVSGIVSPRLLARANVSQSATGTSFIDETPSSVTESRMMTNNPSFAPAATNGDIIIDPSSDPTGPAIPVGDGMFVLLILSATYLIAKRKQLI